jgi:hypothetical protein
MVQDKCALCLKVKPLRRSHLMPKAIYKMCRSQVAVNPNPIAMVGGLAAATSNQAAQYLLCGDCEQSFSAKGERYSLTNCYRPDGSFPFRDALIRNSPHRFQGEDLYYYGSRLLRPDLEPLRFFAASVFWRASVAQWRIPPAGKPLRNRLGKYEEVFQEIPQWRKSIP